MTAKPMMGDLAALSRRQAMAVAFGLGLSVEFLGRKAFAAADGAAATRKLIVIICRGGMDGLSVSPPVGDRNYAGLRGSIAIPGFDSPGGALKGFWPSAFKMPTCCSVSGETPAARQAETRNS